MRGLETFFQLPWGSPQALPAGILISDRPLFPHRGLLLDTARNFFPVPDLLRAIRAMSHNKLNVFHWHLTDRLTVLPPPPLRARPRLTPRHVLLRRPSPSSRQLRHEPRRPHRVLKKKATVRWKEMILCSVIGSPTTTFNGLHSAAGTPLILSLFPFFPFSSDCSVF